jgi:NADPH:quinone reductase-like Zn-dependent oxidoreductase
MDVLIDPALSCGACERCRAGEQSECVKFTMLGEHVHGTFAERVKVPQENVFPYPAYLSASEAAALGVTFMTAYRMLFTKGGLKPGEWVLITGVGGGLGTALLALARPVAGRVYVTSSSAAKLDRARALGADEGIDYKRSDVGKEIRRLTSKRGVDLVVDSAAGPTVDASMRALRKGGRVVIAGATAGAKATIDARRLFWNQLSLIGSTMASKSDVSDMLRMVAGTEIRPPIDRTFSLADGAEALRYLKRQEQFGKVVLEIAGA